ASAYQIADRQWVADQVDVIIALIDNGRRTCSQSKQTARTAFYLRIELNLCLGTKCIGHHREAARRRRGGLAQRLASEFRIGVRHPAPRVELEPEMVFGLR